MLILASDEKNFGLNFVMHIRVVSMKTQRNKKKKRNRIENEKKMVKKITHRKTHTRLLALNLFVCFFLCLTVSASHLRMYSL